MKKYSIFLIVYGLCLHNKKSICIFKFLLRFFIDFKSFNYKYLKKIEYFFILNIFKFKIF